MSFLEKLKILFAKEGIVHEECDCGHDHEQAERQEKGCCRDGACACDEGTCECKDGDCGDCECKTDTHQH